MINWEFYRKLFPVASNRTYLMTAGAGAVPIPVLDALADRYKQISERGGDVFGENLSVVENCREKLATLINAKKENIAFIPNVSYGINAIVHSMEADNLFLIPSNEFPSSILPIKNAGKHIQEILPIPDCQNNMINLLQHDYDKPSCLVASWVNYIDGYRLDLDILKNYKKSTDFVINGTQAIGAFTIDVQKYKIDVLVCSCYKWMCCGEGLSFLYIHPDFFKKLKPAFVGWRSIKSSMNFGTGEQIFFDDARVFELGWTNMTLFSGFDAGLSLIQLIGVENIAQRILSLSSELIQFLNYYEIPLITNSKSEHLSGIISIGPFENVDKIFELLKRDNIWVNPRKNSIRISLHFYNNSQDIHRLVNSLNRILTTEKNKINVSI